jgi:hypothetical protein
MMGRRIDPWATMVGLVSLLGALPVSAQVGWRADVSAASIPDVAVTGKIAGSTFTSAQAEILWNPGHANGGSKYPSATFTLRQGREFFADRSISVFLMLKPGQDLNGFTVSVRPIKFSSTSAQQQPHNSYADGLVIPIVQGVQMEYRQAGQRLPKTEMFQDRYSIKLHFGKMSGHRIPGRLFLTLPDAAKSYVVGTFTAEIK